MTVFDAIGAEVSVVTRNSTNDGQLATGRATRVRLCDNDGNGAEFNLLSPVAAGVLVQSIQFAANEAWPPGEGGG